VQEQEEGGNMASGVGGVGGGSDGGVSVGGSGGDCGSGGRVGGVGGCELPRRQHAAAGCALGIV
jgi:hypothetical protein